MLKNFLASKFYWPAVMMLSLVLVFAFRWILLFNYDSTYFNDLYDHSQWRIPLSDRIIGDNDLYLVAGERLVQGQDLFGVAPEVPPLVKYLYGSFNLHWNNPFYVSMMLYVVTGLIFWELGSALRLSKAAHRLSFGLFIISPLMSAQLKQTALDLPLLLFLLTHLTFMIKYVESTKQKARLVYLGVAIMSLGFFAATKFPLFVPIIVVIDLVYLWKHGYSRSSIWLVIGTAALYLFSYLPYFTQGNTINNWFAAQKWIFSFYRGSDIQHTPIISVLVSVVLGVHNGWWKSESWLRITEWSLLWPLVTFCFFYYRKKLRGFIVASQSPKSYVLASSAALFAVLLLIPFWPRYFLIILIPMLPLLATFLLTKPKITSISLAIILIQWINLLFPQPIIDLKPALENWSTTNYQDLYSHLSSTDKNSVSRTTFLRTYKEVDQDMEVELKEVSISQPWVWPWQNQSKVVVSQTVELPFGEQHTDTEVELRRELGVWKINWDWQLVAPGFQPGDAVKTVPDFELLGTLYTLDKNILLKNEPWPAIIVTPSAWIDAEHTLDILQDTTEFSRTSLQYKMYVQSKGLHTVNLGLVQAENREKLEEKLALISSLPGISVIESSKRIYQLPNFETIKIVAEQHPELNGKLGGNIILVKDSAEENLLWRFPSILPKDVVLEQSTTDFL